jgi:hypothetical protein
MNKIYEMSYYFCVGEYEVLCTDYIICERIEEAQDWANSFYEEYFYDEETGPDDNGYYWDNSQECYIKPECIREIDGIYAWETNGRFTKVKFDDKSK